MMSSHPLPFRMAQCRHSRLDAFTPEYFDFLARQGCGAIYLQNSPIDPLQTGNVGQFYTNFHLIRLFDIARSHRRQEYQDYINEVGVRAARHGIDVWLDCWEPRLPAYAQTLLPPEWRGRGGWGWHGRKEIAFCWEHPEAVAFWKEMAKDALAALPGISGAIVSMIDNESSFCDASCPRCEGRSLHTGIVDVFATFRELAARHPKGLRLAMYDWWMPEAVTDAIFSELPAGSLVIGRSSRGITFTAPDGSWSGKTFDISNAIDDLAPDFPAHCERAFSKQLQPIDMVAWGRGMENFFLPAPPDPLFAIRKCRSIHEAGAVGWMDYDCGCLEPGSMAEAMRQWTAAPTDTEDELVGRTLAEIWGEEAVSSVRPAYDLYREAKRWMPVAIHSRLAPNVDGRGCGFGFCLFAPFHAADLGFIDTDHAWNYFAPYNLLVEDTIPPLLESTRRVTEILEKAASVVAGFPSGAAGWESAVFEIHWRSFRAFRNYVSLASAKWDYAHGAISPEVYEELVRGLAINELDNLDGIEVWNRVHPGQLGNPCHRIFGHLHSAWPSADFTDNLFAPKRRSLEFLRDAFAPSEFVPACAIQDSGAGKVLAAKITVD